MKNMEIRHFRVVAAVAQQGSLHKAAQQLNTSQPALSRLLAEAEDRMGAQLFVRHSQGSALTQTGQLVLGVAHRVLADVERLERVTKQAGWRLRVGCIARMLDRVVPMLTQFPAVNAQQLEIELLEADSPTLERKLAEGLLDLAVLSPIEALSKDIKAQVIASDQNVFVAGLHVQHPRDAAHWTPQDLAAAHFIAPAPNTPSRWEYENYWRTQHCELPLQVMTARTYDVIAEVLTRTAWMSVMPEGPANRHARNGSLQILRVTRELPLRSIQVAWPTCALQPMTDEIVALLMTLPSGIK